MADFVPLSCTGCGASIEVYADMDRFACQACGTQMQVRRRGGTVSLSSVEAVLRRVRVGTDKTAAELALMRYKQELKELEPALAAAEAQQAQKGNSCARIGVLLLIGAAASFSALYDDLARAVVIGGLFAAVGLILCYIANQQSRDVGPVVLSMRKRVQELKRSIAEKTAIVEAQT
jgi:hypothetical protein